MSDTLRQPDIDALFGTVVAPVVVPVAYDFLRPARLPRERHAAVESVYARFASRLQALLESQLRQPLEVAVASVELASASEFLQSLPVPCAAWLMAPAATAATAAAPGVLALEVQLAQRIVERLFGGASFGARPERALTPLEQNVVRAVVEKMFADLRESWRAQSPLALELGAAESDPSSIRCTDREAGMLVAVFEVRAKESLGSVTVGLPQSLLEQPRPARTTERDVAPRAESEPERALMSAHLRRAHVSLAVQLPRVWLPAHEVAAFRAGQVLSTGLGLESTIDVTVNGRLRYRGVLGQVDGRLGLRITQTVDALGAERTGRDREGRAL
jgi:flagellar motor switch protein FliM